MTASDYLSQIAAVNKGSISNQSIEFCRSDFFKPEFQKNWNLIRVSVKRLVDLFLSLIAIIVLSPLMMFLALVIYAEDRGALFFIQKRWGKNCEPFSVIKFRSISPETTAGSWQLYTMENGVNVTRVGRILRKTNLDELPQLINILRGDMSLVGPRCHPVDMQVSGISYEEIVPDYHCRHCVRPGLTGLAQSKGSRGPVEDIASAETRFALDMEYLRNFSLFLDFKILFQTIVRESSGGTGS